MNFMKIIVLSRSGGLKTLTFLRNYWCFCDVRILAKIMTLSENHEIDEVLPF